MLYLGIAIRVFSLALGFLEMRVFSGFSQKLICSFEKTTSVWVGRTL
jgi:hypothetical protein